MSSSILPALIVMQQEKERKREEEWQEQRLERDASDKKYREENPYLYSCSTPSIQGSCSNNGNSFENKPTENE